MADIVVARLSYDTPHIVGTLHENGTSFTYSERYLSQRDAVPLSLSLPLRDDPFDASELRPYFEGLIAEGMTRRALAETLQVAEEDYVAILAHCGRECIGDVLVWYADDQPVPTELGYSPLALDELAGIVRGLPESSAENASSRLSLAGTQNKIGLAHNPNLDFEHGWLRPKGLAATTHLLKTSYLRDLPEIEYLCMSAAAGCGIAVARTHLLTLPTPTLAVERFDRNVNVVDGTLHVERRHQEDLTQAFSLTPGSKYAELLGGSVASIAQLIRSKSVLPARDLAQFARTLLFCYAIGNCDAHLKNYSIVLEASKRDGEPLITLAPAYDLVSTTRYPRFSRDLAVAIGGVRAIDDVDSAALANLAKDLGITKAALQGFARDIVDNAVAAIDAAGAGACGSVFGSTPYVADDLVEEMSPRLGVLDKFCNG